MNNERRRALQNIVERLQLIRKEARAIEKAEQKAFSKMAPNLRTRTVCAKHARVDSDFYQSDDCLTDAIRLYKRAAK